MPMGFARREPGRRGCAVEACRAGTVYGGFLKESEGDQMIDREKVINALEDYEPYAREFDSLSVYGWVVLDALALLKEQEAVEPIWSCGKPFCGACGLRIHGGKFCSKCGKPILWKGR